MYEPSRDWKLSVNCEFFGRFSWALFSPIISHSPRLLVSSHYLEALFDSAKSNPRLGLLPTYPRDLAQRINFEKKCWISRKLTWSDARKPIGVTFPAKSESMAFLHLSSQSHHRLVGIKFFKMNSCIFEDFNWLSKPALSAKFGLDLSIFQRSNCEQPSMGGESFHKENLICLSI